MKSHLLILAILFSTYSFSQTKSINVDYNTNIGTGKKMTGVNTGPHSIVSGTTEKGLQSIGTELVRTHDYHGACDYWGYTKFFNYFNQTFDYTFQSHITTGYNWTTTDAQIAEIVNANLQPFFRLGISFPGGGISPASPIPKDADGINFRTFAGIAKRTAMHYTGGWNNGFNYTIPYWEIWNEPNNNASWKLDSVSAYYRLYKQTVDSLKSFNSLLKLGGPATAKGAFYNGGIHFTINQDYVSNFFNFCKTNSVSLDFYSFHMYDKPNPYNIRILTDTLTYFLNQYGFTKTELIISETNINTGGYDNTSKGCSYLTSELISLVNTRMSKFIWYRGVDLNPLCNSDVGTTPNLTMNGYAYKFFNYLNDSTPILLNSSGNEFDASNIIDSLNNVMILSGKNAANTKVKILISNHESVYSTMNVALKNLPWTSADKVQITIEKVTTAGYNSASSTVTGGANINVNLPSVTDASVFMITLKKESATLVEKLVILDENIIYPNPASTNVYVKTKLKNFHLKLTNDKGQVIISQKNNSEIQLGNIPNGVYFIQIQNEQGKVDNYKVLIVK